MSASTRLRRALPQGRTLPVEDLTRRHRFLLALLWAHVVALPALALGHGASPAHAAAEGAVALAFATVATALGPSHRRPAAAIVATGLLACSATLVHLTGGAIEAHFHFFVVIVLLTLYEDWLLFGLAVVEVALHHGVMGAVAPQAVFNHADAIAHPWRWAAIHAGFVAAAGAAAVATWRLNEDVREQQRQALARARAAERDAADALAELERSNRDLEHFAAIASHDLSEPLRTVTGFLRLLETRTADRLGDDGRLFVRHALDGSDRMQRLIDGLLELSRAGRGAVPDDPVDLDAVAAVVREALGDAIARTGATVRVGPLPTVLGDERQLGQLLQNLMANALKFSAGTPHVEVRARPDGERWVLSVVDDGMGIDARDAERAFEPFHRLAATDGVEGSGIGLSVCRRIAERHGGRIWAEPAPGGGTAVHVTLAGAPPGLGGPPARRARGAYSATMPS